MPTLRCFICFVVLASIMTWGAVSTCRAQTGSTLNADVTLTAEVLQETLYAKTADEIEYCKFVIRMRDEKKLPNRTLYYAYKKAIQQEKSRRFVYFQKTLEMACNYQGIVLEDSAATQVKKFFGFSSNTAKTGQATKTPLSAPVLAKPTTQSSAGKPFSFIHRIFSR